MRKTILIITTIIILSSLLVGTGYATNMTNQTEFKVRFSGELTVSNENNVDAMVINDQNAIVNITNLNMQENVETVTYIVENASIDLSAELTANITNSNKEYFLIETTIEKNILTKGETTKVNVKIELIKEPTEKDETATIGIQLIATPIQPIEDNTSNTVIKPNTDISEGLGQKDETPKTGDFRITDIFRRFKWKI